MDLENAYLGGPFDHGRMGEGHEVELVVAAERTEATSKAKAEWRGAPPGPIDDLERIVRVDGCCITLTGWLEGLEGLEGLESTGAVEMETCN